MCYYSVTLKPSSYRDERVGEDLTLRGDGTSQRNASHHYPTGEDGKIVCVAHGATAHFEKLELNPVHAGAIKGSGMWLWLHDKLGKPCTVRMSPSSGGYASDYLDFGQGLHLALIHVKAGSRFYTGEKRQPKLELEAKLGMEDPSYVLDHKPVTAEEPGLVRTIGRALGVCSIIK